MRLFPALGILQAWEINPLNYKGMAKRELTEEERALRTRLGSAIRIASAQKGFKPADLAAAAGVALSQQYRIENGELTADVLYLVKVSALLGISIDALLRQAQVEVVLEPAPAPAPKDTSQAAISVRGNRNVIAGRDVIQTKKGR